MKLKRRAAVLPKGKHEFSVRETPSCPLPFAESFDSFIIDTPGMWGLISDIHCPYHDRTTLELFVRECKRHDVAGVLLNGDTLDSHEISRHDKDPSAPRYVEEIATCRQLLAWIRAELPDVRIVAKEGNHEERLQPYLTQQAPALRGLEGVDLPTWLHFQDHGIEWVSHKRVIDLGRLPVVHGHEFPGRGVGGVSPARGLFQKAHGTAICGHHHRTSEHHTRDIRGRERAAWSTGCACFLSPSYMPINEWNHGFALVDVAQNGEFGVSNKRVFNGKVL